MQGQDVSNTVYILCYYTKMLHEIAAVYENRFDAYKALDKNKRMLKHDSSSPDIGWRVVEKIFIKDLT